MPARTLPVWCADLLVTVDPCAKGSDATAQGDRYPRENEIWDANAGLITLAGAAGEVLSFQLVLEKRAGYPDAVRLEGAEGRWIDMVVIGEDRDPYLWVNLKPLEIDPGSRFRLFLVGLGQSERFKGFFLRFHNRFGGHVELHFPREREIVAAVPSERQNQEVNRNHRVTR